MSSFYRFRSIYALLDGREELERQEMYFAAPEQLNDPMEGFKDLFWRGDSIIWKNFIKHYLLCLIRQLSLVLISGEAYRYDLSNNLVFASSTNHPTNEFKEMYEKICVNFFADTAIQKIPVLLSECKHQIRREELRFYFGALQDPALLSVMDGMKEHGLLPASSNVPKFDHDAKAAIDILLGLIQESIKNSGDQERKFFDKTFSAAEHANKQANLIRYLNAGNERVKLWLTAVVEFPELYVKNLEKLVFYPWYAACFVSDPTHAAMWGNYGDGHKGVCLQFSGGTGVENFHSLKFRGITGWSSGPKGSQKVYGDVQLPYSKMRYVDRFVEVDFFRSIGRISNHALYHDWYLGDDGKLSACSDDLHLNEDGWRKAYWEKFQSTISAKLLDWQHEGEHRLVLYSILDSLTDPDDRKLVYDFKYLEGIVFGINTPIEDKRRIVDIIKRKSVASGRTSFDFGQAYYSVDSAKIQIGKLNLLSL